MYHSLGHLASIPAIILGSLISLIALIKVSQLCLSKPLPFSISITTGFVQLLIYFNYNGSFITVFQYLVLLPIIFLKLKYYYFVHLFQIFEAFFSLPQILK